MSHLWLEQAINQLGYPYHIIEYYGDDLSIIERQMISRMGMDAINKHTIYILEGQYFGSALIGVNERPWSGNHCFEDRINISV